jgi:hypothetical protein
MVNFDDALCRTDGKIDATAIALNARVNQLAVALDDQISSVAVQVGCIDPGKNHWRLETVLTVPACALPRRTEVWWNCILE